jgi:hypothetical protein
MAQAEWLACTDPKPMFEFLVGKASDRKPRLFACASCRRIWHLLVDERSRRAIEVAELFIEGDVSQEVLATAITAADGARLDVEAGSGTEAQYEAAVAATKAAFCAGVTAEDYNRDAWIYAEEDTSWHVRYALETQGGEHASLLRELFGPLPFGPVPLDPSWLAWNSSTVARLGRAIYDERAFDHLPILADALEEAGCTELAILDHCRSGGEHVRGCWVLDLLLGKQ